MLKVISNQPRSQNQTVTQQQRQKQNVSFGSNTVIVFDSFKALLKQEISEGNISKRNVKKINKLIKILEEGTWLEKLTGTAEKRNNTVILSCIQGINTSIFYKKPWITDEFHMTVSQDGKIMGDIMNYPTDILKKYRELLGKIKAESMVK